jgi:endo-1,4-beta-xylanase
VKKYLALLLLALLATTSACSKDSKEVTTDTVTQALTVAPTATPAPPEIIEYKPAEPFDSDGRAVAMFGSPVIDGIIDDVWQTAGIITPTIISSANVQAVGEFRVLWDDNALYCLYTITDPELNKANANTYEQDSVEVFLDEMNDKATSYQNDDVHYRVNFDNEPSTDAGDSSRYFTATSELLDATGMNIGYIVETSLTWVSEPANYTIMGFDLQINDAGSAGTRLGTITIFDEKGTAWSTPSSMGEIVLKGKGANSISNVNPNMLKIFVGYVERLNPDGYVNSNLLIQPLTIAKELLNNPAATQEQIDSAEAMLREIVALLDDGSGFVNVVDLPEKEALTDPYTFFDGTKVTSTADWAKRAEEIANLYEYYMYGVVPDASDEKVSYEVLGANKLKITVVRGANQVDYTVDYSLPDSNKVPMPEGGYPVLFAFGWLMQTQYANDHGYATIVLNTEAIAADNTSHTGVFYDLYPYGDIWTEQTGTLLAWGWGISKIIDALEQGADKELNINAENTILTGVSRWGKAAAVTGAFDKRIKVTAPSCSGSGGMASFRYKSEGKTYDYSGIDVAAPYTMTTNEPISSLQSSSERQWFNDKFLEFDTANALPFDQHLLAALCAEEDRYLFITGSYLYEDWTNPPGMWATYLAAKDIFEYLDVSDHIAIHIHKEGHMVTDEDMVYLLDFCDHHFYSKKIMSNLEDLTTSLFAEEANYDPFFDPYIK